MTIYFGTELNNTLFTQASQIARAVLDIDLQVVRDAIKDAASYITIGDPIIDVVANELDLEIPLISRSRLPTSLNVGDTFILMETNLPSGRTEYSAKEISEILFLFTEYKVLPTRGKRKVI